MKIAVFGAKGRVGGKVCEIARMRHHTVCEVDVGSTPDIVHADVVIDFSTAEATEALCRLVRKLNCPLVSGTTGRDERQLQMLQELSLQVPVICKANFSQGAALLEKICEFASEQTRLWDCEIVEMHRKGKKDAPGGTAKSIAAAIAEKRSFGSVVIHSLRGGSCVGAHSVVLANGGERLTLTHTAEDISIFAQGAVIEAEKLLGA